MKVARLVVVALTILSIFIVTRLELSRDLTQLFPDTVEAATLARVTRMTGGGDVTLVLLRGDDSAAVARAADDTRDLFEKDGSFEKVVTGPPHLSLRDVDATGAWRWAGPIARDKLARAVTEKGMRARLRETRALLLAPGASEVAAFVAKDPLRLSQIPWEEHLELAAGARGAPGEPFTADGGKARLLVVVARGKALEAREAAAVADRIGTVMANARSNHTDVRFDAAGGHLVAKETEAMIRSDLQKSGVLSLVLASVVFVAIFRRPRALLAVMPPLLAGTLWTTALATLLYSRLSAVATAFAAVVIGVGVDTGVHVYGHLLAARRAGHSSSEAAAMARRETWKPTLGAALAAGGAFGCLALSNIRGVAQLGVLCAIGEVTTAIAILVVVPEVGAWLERGAAPSAVSFDFVTNATRTKTGARIVLVATAVAVVLAFVFGQPTVSHSVVTEGTSTLPSMEAYKAIYATFGGTRGQLFVVASDPDPERARARADAVAEVCAQLEARGSIVGYDALGAIAPSVTAQRARLSVRDALDLPSRRKILERVLHEEGFAVEELGPALDAFAHPSEEVADHLADDSSALAWIARRHLGTDDHGTLATTFVRLTGAPDKDAEARAAIRAADPGAILTGFAELEASLRASLAADLPRILGAALGVVIIVLAFALSRALLVVFGVAILIIELALVLFIAKLLHIPFHVYDALVLPVLLGITLDETLFLLSGAERRGLDEALAEQAPFAAATALTTAAGFAALVVCRFGGLVDLGKVGAIGSVVGLSCALLLVPAGLRVARRR